LEEQFRVVQVSDTHLSHRHPHFLANWRRFAAAIAEAPPRLVVNTGDASLAGARHREDLAAAAELHAALPCAWRIVPGNHDAGDHPALCDGSGRRLPATRERLAAFRAALGPDRFLEDIGGWRLLGINGMLLGSDLPEEEEQFDWIEAARAGAGGRLLALFLHKPPFLSDPSEPGPVYWSVDPRARARLMRLLDDPRLRLVGCGHLHEHFARRHGAAEMRCCPSLAFVASPALQPEAAGGTRETGWLEHVFTADRVVTRVVADGGLAPTLLDDVVDEVYPERRR
jgi:3',5'-cyclic AMP phosphodiesterase CpdA